MAKYYGVQATKRLVNLPSDKTKANEQHGDQRISYDIYTIPGNLAVGDVITFGKLPKGARVTDFWLKNSNLGTTGAGNFGWAASADLAEAGNASGFLAAVSVATAAATSNISTQANVVGLGKEFQGECDVQFVVTTATTAAGTLEACVSYVVT